mgnify:CR=1 FL=1
MDACADDVSGDAASGIEFAVGTELDDGLTHCLAAFRDRLDLETDRYDLARFGVDAYGDDPHGSGRQTTKATRRDDREKLPVKWETATCEGKLYEDYLHDMALTVAFAEENRRRIAETICHGLGLTAADRFSCVHNYIDENRILRKGAISARRGERVLIPLNMRDGALIGIGQGNPDWNFSAPHGAGRLMSRGQAKEAFTVEEYQKQMNGIYTTSVNQSTLDECPMAYKNIEDIVNNIGDTVEINAIIKRIYNFKAGDEK